jgi:hypothetical protein
VQKRVQRRNAIPKPVQAELHRERLLERFRQAYPVVVRAA